MPLELYDHQISALNNMHNGCILCGGVGSGKSRTSLAYYHLLCGGKIYPEFEPIPDETIKDLYIITTARKRDTLDWESEMFPFGMSSDPKINRYKNIISVDSWNNIEKYVGVKDAFFIFDEQRVVGNGTWVKAFLKITKLNKWILLSATPGDTWMDYIPVFIANGFYKNRTDFIHQHVVFNRACKFPKVDRYVNTGRLIRLRGLVLVDMTFKRSTESHDIDCFVEYDKNLYKKVLKDRWDIYKDEPIVDAAGLCRVLRKIVNTDKSREQIVLNIIDKHKRVIIFYNYDYELEILQNLLEKNNIIYSEWNGHKHQDIPFAKSIDLESNIEYNKLDTKWAYLVQYNACEGWNCTRTDTIIFYSQNYSYKVMVQASGRINRLNTPYKDLYYYHLKSKSGLDIAINRALKAKKQFNESKFLNNYF